MPTHPPPFTLLGVASLARRRAAFWLFASILFIATHWPALEIQVPRVRRPDIILHAGSFAAWYLLLYFAAYFGSIGTRARRPLLAPYLVAITYAAADEALQLIPAIRRHAAWDDWAADVGGITLGLIVATIWTMSRRHPVDQ